MGPGVTVWGFGLGGVAAGTRAVLWLPAVVAAAAAAEVAGAIAAPAPAPTPLPSTTSSSGSGAATAVGTDVVALRLGFARTSAGANEAIITGNNKNIGNRYISDCN